MLITLDVYSKNICACTRKTLGVFAPNKTITPNSSFITKDAWGLRPNKVSNTIFLLSEELERLYQQWWLREYQPSLEYLFRQVGGAFEFPHALVA